MQESNNPEVEPRAFEPNEATTAALAARDHMLVYRASERGSQQSEIALQAANELFEATILLTERPLWHDVLQRTGLDHDATAEILQRTYIRGYRYIHKFRGENAQVDTWLHRIAYNQLSTYYKSKAKEKHFFPLDTVANDEEHFDNVDRLQVTRRDNNPEDALVDKEELGVILSAISNLQPRHRTVVEMKWLCGMTHDQIASALGVTVSSSKIIVMRVREKLQKSRTRDENGDA